MVHRYQASWSGIDTLGMKQQSDTEPNYLRQYTHITVSAGSA